MFTVLSTVFSLMFALLTTLMAVWAFNRPPRFTRMRMSYKLVASAPLIHESFKPNRTLIVKYGGKSLRNPHVVQIQVSNPGKRNVPSSAFDGAAPLQIMLGVKIVALISATHSPSWMPEPRVVFRGKRLNIGPSLIERDATIHIALLVDGPCAALMHTTPFSEVALQQEFPREEMSRHLGLRRVASYAVIAFLVWWIIKDPASASHLVTNIGSFLSSAASGLARFVASI
jgi:hypothetical protein